VPIYSGAGRICRVEPAPRGAKIALHLTSGFLDIPALAARHREALLRTELEEGLNGAQDRIDPEYRRIAADLLHLLRHYRTKLQRFEGKLNGSARPDGEAVNEALALCEERVLPEWREHWYRANEVVRPLIDDPEVLKATKRFTELVVTPDFMEGPIWRHAYEKPLGYPGDFELMKQVYAWRQEGETAFGKLLHRMGLDVAECIATRMVMMQQAIAEVVATRPDGETAHIATLGCGPAQEVANYLQLRKLPNAASLTLIDQEHDALSWAYEHTYPDAVRLGAQASVRCLEVSFSELMKAGQLFKRLPPQELIYSVGLIDYLTQRRARALVASLYDQLAPGGRLIVGNMKDTAFGNLWPLEFVCDWSLYYRDEAQMRDLAADLPGATIEIKQDPTGRVYLLYLSAP